MVVVDYKYNLVVTEGARERLNCVSILTRIKVPRSDAVASRVPCLVHCKEYAYKLMIKETGSMMLIDASRKQVQGLSYSNQRAALGGSSESRSVRVECNAGERGLVRRDERSARDVEQFGAHVALL